jgi:hypothetical protein
MCSTASSGELALASPSPRVARVPGDVPVLFNAIGRAVAFIECSQVGVVSSFTVARTMASVSTSSDGWALTLRRRRALISHRCSSPL